MRSTALSLRDNTLAPDALQEAASSQFLSFLMAGEEYAVDILAVQEIRGWETATALPNAPIHIEGVINLRGVIVPVVDLRRFFGLPASAHSAQTVVVILNAEYAGQPRVLGIMVDSVSEVIDVQASQIKPAPDFSTQIDIRYIQGLLNMSARVVIVLSAEKLLDRENLN